MAPAGELDLGDQDRLDARARHGLEHRQALLVVLEPAPELVAAGWCGKALAGERERMR
jgi:hypothetical protein